MKIQCVKLMRLMPFVLCALALFLFSTSTLVFAANIIEQQESSEGALDELTDKAKKLGESLAAQTKIQPVDYQDLKKLLPKKSLPSLSSMIYSGCWVRTCFQFRAPVPEAIRWATNQACTSTYFFPPEVSWAICSRYPSGSKDEPPEIFVARGSRLEL